MANQSSHIMSVKEDVVVVAKKLEKLERKVDHRFTEIRKSFQRLETKRRCW